MAAIRQENDQILEIPWDKLILAPGTQPTNIPLFPYDGKKNSLQQ